MTQSEITEKIAPAVQSLGCFLTEVKVSKDNDIEIVIESKDGTVTMDDCVALDKIFHGIWDQDQEDYSLTVSSAGLGRPFKVAAQYRKAIGKEVVALLKGGRKITAVLEAADEDSITLNVKGTSETIPFTSVNSVMYSISFE